MTMPEVVDLITGYAKDIAAPVQTDTTVTSVRPADDGYRVTTDQGEWQCRTVVLATGAFNVPRVPDFADGGPASVATLTPMDYRNPGDLAEGGVLVVGASATGVQIAHEIQRSGRPVTLAVGEHARCRVSCRRARNPTASPSPSRRDRARRARAAGASTCRRHAAGTPGRR